MPTDRERDLLAVLQMREAIAGLRETTAGQTRAAIAADWMRARALERGFEIISEASRRLSPDARAAEPEIPWRQIADIGNVLRHEYHRVAVSVLLDTLTKDVPLLDAALARLEARLSGG